MYSRGSIPDIISVFDVHHVDRKSKKPSAIGLAQTYLCSSSRVSCESFAM